MISTVTTSTVTTVANTSLAAGLGLMLTLALIALLIVKELTGAYVTTRNKAGGTNCAAVFDRVLNVAIAPFLLVFAFIVVVKTIGVLR